MIAGLLASATSEPSALLIEGEPGIGKTTLWLDALELAQERSFRVLSARAAAAESVLAYTALADLLAGVPASTWADIPEPQRFAVDQVLMRSDNDTATDQRAVAAAFLSVVECLTDDGPLLVAIDDLQWIDPSSMHVIAFAARRLTGPVGILASVRTDGGNGTASDWLQMPRPDALNRIMLSPLGIKDLHAAVSARLRRPFSRPTMGRIHQVSGGNPFYAIELARAIAEKVPEVETSLPRTLADVVRARINGVDPDVHDALLAASCMASPTVDLVSRATISDDDRLIELLEIAENKGVIALDGNRIQFTHPLLARGVYTEAAPGQRRTMHRRLAEIVDEPELRARHLALAATSGDVVTLQALDEAAESARMRGAPVAAAELMELAIGLGGDTADRRLRSALHHFDAGDHERARAALEEAIERLPGGDLRAEALSRLAVVRLYGDGYYEASRLLQRALREVHPESPLQVQILITLAYALLQANQPKTGMQMAEEAVAQADRLDQSHLLGLALGMRVILRYLCGHGFDEPDLHRAVQLEDRDIFTPLVFRPTVQRALLLEWTGRLDEAHQELEVIRRRCVEKGEEGELIFIAQHVVLTSIWRGDFVGAGLVADDAMERARQLGGDTPLFLAHSLRTKLATYAGREADARQAAGKALEFGTRTGAFRLMERVVAALGFLEVSLGRYESAITTLQPLVTRFDPASTPTELPNAGFMVDAIEALIQADRGAEAEPLIEALERNGAQQDRAWMLAVAARSRSMLLAARGDLDAANAAIARAMAEHDRLPMPFERARTLLLLGQLQRRQRRKESASASLQEALDVFEKLNIPLWADRARAELTRANVGPRHSGQLTPSEQRVAELAASGMKNRDVATTLFISPKTVEANLARIYRKLGIKSRAELGRHMGRT
jgi:DNA-binding NarL/FixJ family response regulator